MALEPKIKILCPRVHLTKEHFHHLYGENAYLEFAEAIGLQGGFLARQKITIATALGRMEEIPIVGPLNNVSGVECHRSATLVLGKDPPVRDSLDFEESPCITLIGPKGHMKLSSGLISLCRTLQVSPENARRLALLDQDFIACLVRSERRFDFREAPRDVILSDVYVKISDNFDLELQLDEDDANACRAVGGDFARLLLSPGKVDSKGYLPVGRLVGEKDIRLASEKGLRIRIKRGVLLTPSAKDLGRELDLLDFVD
jgi:putative phosphotransacetylase